MTEEMQGEGTIHVPGKVIEKMENLIEASEGKSLLTLQESIIINQKIAAMKRLSNRNQIIKALERLKYYCKQRGITMTQERGSDGRPILKFEKEGVL